MFPLSELFTTQYRSVTALRVVKSWKGAQIDESYIVAQGDPDLCQVHIDQGETYLVYADRRFLRNDELQPPSLCSRT